MINVRYYKTASARKRNEVFGEFFTQAVPEEVKPVNEELKGKKLEADKQRFEEETEQALLKAKFRALDEVRTIVGTEGVLVAYEVKEEE